MADRVRDWRADLVAAYSDLFDPTAGDPPTARGWPYVDEGWRDLLERACVRIRTAVQADGGSLHVTQIMEKYGTLRFYWAGSLSPEANARVEEAIDLAEARSAVTCEICGEPGVLYGGRWVTTRCANHAEGRRPVQSEPGDQIYVFERVVGNRQDVLHRRYDREGDGFIDVTEEK
ncbi:hypothetical protein [Bradyrhizobium genosp. P]|uniref:hypothetical protein n=1 Tax=Bradyrhizobium genosp. P TaxID=83641 RepID=UPI003CEDAABC